MPPVNVESSIFIRFSDNIKLASVVNSSKERETIGID